MDQRYWLADAAGLTLSSPSLPPAEPCLVAAQDRPGAVPCRATAVPGEKQEEKCLGAFACLLQTL